jgi:hypothetical protein
MTDKESPASSTKKSSGGTTVRTTYPVASFEGEGFPTITSEGTQLSNSELKTAQEAADAGGVELVVEDGS